MRISDVIGKPVVAADTGEKLGRVDDVLIDPGTRRITGVLVGDFVTTAQRVLPFSDVRTVGRHAVIAYTGSLVDAGEWLDNGRPAHRSRAVQGLDVLNADGSRLGTVNDLLANDSGELYAMEVAMRQHGSTRAYHALLHVGADVELLAGGVIVTGAAPPARARAADKP